MHWHGQEEQFDFILITPPSRRHSLGPKESFSAGDFSHGEEGECVSEHLTSSAVRNTAKEALFSLTPSRLLSHELQDWGWWRGKNLGEQKDLKQFNFTQ